jgi:hypothetical protein
MRISSLPDEAVLKFEDLFWPWYKAVCHHPHCVKSAPTTLRIFGGLFEGGGYGGEFAFPVGHDAAGTDDEDAWVW